MNFRRASIYTKQMSMMFQDIMVYRADVISRYLGRMMQFAIAAFLWLAILEASGGDIAGYDQAKTLTYFLLIQVVSGFTFSAAQAGFYVGSEIQSGSLSNRLVLPVDYIKLLLAITTGRGLFYFISNMVLFTGIGIVFNDYFNFEFSLFFIGVAALCMITGFLINFGLISCIGMLAFWTSSSTRLIFSFFAIISLLAGLLVPLDFFPMAVQNVLNWTPFPYLFFFPVKVLQSSAWDSSLSLGLAISCGYAVLCMSMTYLVYHLGLRKYEAVGK